MLFKILYSTIRKVLDVDVSFGPETIAMNDIDNPSLSSSACLIMDGLSSIEIDTRGIFMALPVSSEAMYVKPASVGSDDIKTETRSNRYMKKTASYISMGSYTSSSNSSTSIKKTRKETSNEARMILHIPASEHIKVTCAQPASLIISIPLQRGPPLNPSPMGIILPISSSNSTKSADPMTSSVTKEKDISESYPLGRFAAPLHSPSDNVKGQEIPNIQSEQGMPIAPWSYIQNHNQTAIDITEDDEIRSSDFALMLTSLEGYIASLSVTASDVRVIIACADRIQRDTMVLALRSLAGQHSAATIAERRKVFPWSFSPQHDLSPLMTGSDGDSVVSGTGSGDSPRDYIPSPILPDSLIVTVVKADVEGERNLASKIDQLENEIKNLVKKEVLSPNNNMYAIFGYIYLI